MRQAANLDENRVVLYKQSKQLGNGYYIVEISTNSTHLFIAAYDIESQESLLIELEQRKAHAILQEFQNDYEKMAQSLQVTNKRLVLINPVSLCHPTSHFSAEILLECKLAHRSWPVAGENHSRAIRRRRRRGGRGWRGSRRRPRGGRKERRRRLARLNVKLTTVNWQI